MSQVKNQSQFLRHMLGVAVGRTEDRVSGHVLRAAIELIFCPVQERDGEGALTEHEKRVCCDALDVARWYASASPEYRAAIMATAEAARKDTRKRLKERLEAL